MKQPRRVRGNEAPKVLTSDHLRRIVAVASARELGFVDLVGLAELDPATAFRGAVIRGADLCHQDLSGFDLTGVRLIDCRLTGLDLSRARGVTEATLMESDRDDTVRLPPSLRDAFWAAGTPPSWAEDWGRDRYGPWVSFRVPRTEVRQRMRWVPSGEFMMGSPEDEPGRFAYESPLHLVTIARGFWMFETACPHELWQAVTGQKPGSSRGSSYPVTSVSWTDARGFASQLNGALPGIALELPSESRWEYACRAGTRTPYHFGKRISTQRVRYGSDGPVDAGGLPPNAWGLHEMHGNVWEWCEDTWYDNYNGATDDASARVGSSRGEARRVVRGGSWSVDPWSVRAASRDRYEPWDRDDDLGFRCARGHNVSELELAAPADPARGRKRGAPPSARDAGGATERSGRGGLAGGGRGRHRSVNRA